MRILLTGVAGFIGFHLVKRLIERGETVVGIDNLNDYYEVSLKIARLNRLRLNESTFDSGKIYQSQYSNFKFVKDDITNVDTLRHLFEIYKFDFVINLAAQAGVRYSIENPSAYIQSNLVGFANILECCRNFNVNNLIYASSSSVYGGNKKMPFSENDDVSNPVSLYAATKKSNELMATAYSNLYGINAIGLRFFTVYGPWGRPDMAPMLFLDTILNNRPIKVFNDGKSSRDFTYIDDVVDGIMAVMNKKDLKTDVYNIARGNPTNLLHFISLLEDRLGKNADKVFLPMQKGDMEATYADISKISAVGYSPKVNIEEGIKEFVIWAKEYYKENKMSRQ